MLWRIEYFVEGKNLEKALASVAGIAINMSTPQPVTGAMVVTEGKIKKVKSNTAPVEGSYKDQFMAWLKTKQAGSRITSSEMKEHFVNGIGGKKTSFNNVLMNAVIEAGIIKRLERGQYQIL